MQKHMRCSSLDEVRENIDRIDNEIVKLIAERSFYVAQASQFKRSENDVKAPDRVKLVIDKVRKKAVDNNINPDIVATVYKTMINCFINMEFDEFNKPIK